jgi:hypothetical protein
MIVVNLFQDNRGGPSAHPVAATVALNRIGIRVVAIARCRLAENNNHKTCRQHGCQLAWPLFVALSPSAQAQLKMLRVGAN